MDVYQGLTSEQELATAFKIFESFALFFSSQDYQVAASQAREELQSLESAELRIAVPGETGAGKSSFINTIRGLRPREKDVAEIGVNETMMKPTPYHCLHYLSVTFYELPDIGSMNYKPEIYLRDLNSSIYDFIIVASEQF
ncbi:T-cell-specific guanine nucleotide triphosphate-binding protein 2-like [Alligator mississippiensis]|uniref:T-cell-specific guanine nucleotide triphosphate-binding protein 2-like n=1 Tax=Alligator mississippiensis TaxID=8496 RepID=UPI0009073712|nr:T-cell-specific guanine nucleotide triphosphate-binding protein 2-like [Alligator mississippiensis]